MTEFPIRRPGTKLDLGDQGGLDPGNIGASGTGKGRLLSLPLQCVPQTLGKKYAARYSADSHGYSADF